MTQGNDREDQTSRKGPAQRSCESDPREPDLAIDDAAHLEPHVQDQLGRVFRSFCDDLIHQPIPDKFTVLLAQLEAKQRGKK